MMTSRERRGQLGKGKTDPVDALAIARINAREPQLPPVRLLSAQPLTCEPCSTTARTWSSSVEPWSTGPMPSSAACAPAITTRSPT